MSPDIRVLIPGDRHGPWEHALPHEWPAEPLKRLASINPSKLDDTTDPTRAIRYVDISSVDSNGRIVATEELLFGKAPSRARRLVRCGDTVVSTVRTYLRAIAPIEVDDPDLVCSTGFAVLRPGVRLDARFFSYWCRSEFFVDEVCARSVGVSYPAINPSELGNFFVPDPPLSAQRAIADFLDRKTRAIDELIRKKERLIELLQEKRQALITQAVTKGLDPNVPMKDSGVPWLGEIPAHWEAKRLKHLLSRMVDCPHSTPEYSDSGEFAAIRTADIDRGSLDLSAARRVEDLVYKERIQRMTPRTADILYSREGERFGMAALVPASVQLCLAQRMMLFRVAKSHDAAFVMWALNSESAYQQVKQDTVGATSPRVNIPTIANMFVGCPPFREQQQIAHAIEAAFSNLGRVQNNCVGQIDRLREYRQALISAAVTGQIDVSAEAGMELPGAQAG